jgi:hypothetical protein
VGSVDRVRSFLSGLNATGGGDTPEDVLGGMRQALNSSWKSPTRCVGKAIGKAKLETRGTHVEFRMGQAGVSISALSYLTSNIC